MNGSVRSKILEFWVPRSEDSLIMVSGSLLSVFIFILFISDNTKKEEYLRDVELDYSKDHMLTFLARSCVQTHSGDECANGFDENTGQKLLGNFSNKALFI